MSYRTSNSKYYSPLHGLFFGFCALNHSVSGRGCIALFIKSVREDLLICSINQWAIYLILIRSNEMQQYAGVYLLQNHTTCFGCLSHPSSGVHQTVTAASGTGHSVRVTTFRQRGLIRPR